MTTMSLALPRAAAAEPAPRLFNRNVILLSQAQLVSQCGNQAFTIAVTFWTAQTTHSATLTGAMLLANVLPVILLAPFTGAFADRHRSRLRIVAAADLTSGALVTLLGVLCLLQPSALRPAVLFPAVLLLGVCSAFFNPAVNALSPELVPRDRIEALNAFQQSSRQVAVLVSQGVGGVLYALAGPAALFLIDGGSFLFAAASELMIRPPAADRAAAARPPARGAVFAHTAEGCRYVARLPGMIGFLATVAMFNALLMPMTVLLPVFATTYLGADARWYGFLLSAISGGAVAGGVLVGARRWTGRSRRALIVGALATLATALVVLGQLRSRWLAIAVAAGTGVLAAIINVLTVSIIQRRTEPAFRGRVIGLQATLTRALLPIGMVGGGAIADATGRNVPVVYAACGALALAAAAQLVLRRSIRAFLAAE